MKAFQRRSRNLLFLSIYFFNPIYQKKKKKKKKTNFLNPLNIYRFETPFWVLIHNIQGATSCLVKQWYFILFFWIFCSGFCLSHNLPKPIWLQFWYHYNSNLAPMTCWLGVEESFNFQILILLGHTRTTQLYIS